MSCREHAVTTENDAFEAMLARLFLENGDLIVYRELDKAFFASYPDLPVANINNSLKASLFSKNIISTTNLSLNEVC